MRMLPERRFHHGLLPPANKRRRFTYSIKRCVKWPARARDYPLQGSRTPYEISAIVRNRITANR